jgi:sugar phosphate isomerase/epimerase
MIRVGTITDQVSMDFEKALTYIDNLGLRYIEIHALWNKNIEELTDEEVQRAKGLVEAHDMRVSLISSTLFLQCHLDDEGGEFESIDDYFITIYGDYDRHMAALKRCIDLCEVFETDKIRVFGFIEEKPLDDDEAVKRIAEKLKRPVELVEGAGLSLVLENCPHTYLQYGSRTGRVVEAVGSKSIRALWDPANALRSGGSPFPEDYGYIRNLVSHVHAKDMSFEGEPHFIPLGEGTIDYKGILKSLHEDGFDGVLSLEPEYVDPAGGRPEGCRRAYEGIRRVADELGISLQ